MLRIDAEVKYSFYFFSNFLDLLKSDTGGNDSKGREAMRIECRLQYMETEIFIITASDS
jgi:hypothetical protein